MHTTASVVSSPPPHLEQGHAMSLASIESGLSVNLRAVRSALRHVGQLRAWFGALNQEAAHRTWNVVVQHMNLCDVIASAGSKQMGHSSQPVMEGGRERFVAWCEPVRGVSTSLAAPEGPAQARCAFSLPYPKEARKHAFFLAAPEGHVQARCAVPLPHPKEARKHAFFLAAPEGSAQARFFRHVKDP